MKTPQLPKKLLMTLLSLSSLSAQAGEIWVKAGGKLLKVNVRADDSELAQMSGNEILEQLRGADVVDVPMTALPKGQTPSWTEPKCAPQADDTTWTEVKAPQARPALWTEGEEHTTTWTEKR